MSMNTAELSPRCIASEVSFGKTQLPIQEMVGVLGVEPRTSSLSGTRSNQLSYTPFFPLKSCLRRRLRRLTLTSSRLRVLFGDPALRFSVQLALYSNLRVRSLYFNRQPVKIHIWWSRRGSNPRHPACKAGALAN